MNTPHIDANINEIAPTVIMPGDPLRAKKMAEKFLDDAKLVSKTRNNFCYTGTYKGTAVSIMASGMGSGSMGIYSHELFDVYNVKNIIRVGTIGALSPTLHIGDLVVGREIDTDSNYANILLDNATKMECSKKILKIVTSVAKEKNINIVLGKIFSTDTFYAKKGTNEKLAQDGFLGVEMESSALYKNALDLKRNALCLCTVSDEIYSGKGATSLERQNNYSEMFILALETATKL